MIVIGEGPEEPRVMRLVRESLYGQRVNTR